MADYNGDTINDLDINRPADTDSVYTAAPALRQIKRFLTQPDGLKALFKDSENDIYKDIIDIINLNKYDVGQYYLTNDEEVTESSLAEKFSGTWKFIPNGINSLVNYSEIGKSSMELIHRKTYTVSAEVWRYTESTAATSVSGLNWTRANQNTKDINVNYTLEIFKNKCFNLYINFELGDYDIYPGGRYMAIRVPLSGFTIGTWDTFTSSSSHPYDGSDGWEMNNMGGYLTSISTPFDTAIITNSTFPRAAKQHTADRYNAFCKGVMSVLPSELEIEDAETIPESATNKIFVFVRTA